MDNIKGNNYESISQKHDILTTFLNKCNNLQPKEE